MYFEIIFAIALTISTTVTVATVRGMRDADTEKKVEQVEDKKQHWEGDIV